MEVNQVFFEQLPNSVHISFDILTPWNKEDQVK